MIDFRNLIEKANNFITLILGKNFFQKANRIDNNKAHTVQQRTRGKLSENNQIFFSFIFQFLFPFLMCLFC